MDSIIITAIAATGIIGFLAAVILTAASKVMYVKADPVTEKLREALPGANCGVCGYSGCDGYAAAMASGEAQTNLCRPGGEALVKKLSELLGVEAGEGPAQKKAVVRCTGDKESSSSKMDYTGIRTCLAAEQLYGGPGACTFGCLGYGDCAAVCPESAICIVAGIACINSAKCGGCEKCVTACPRGVITMQDAQPGAAVLCSNTEKGAIVRKKCVKGCIACSKCVRECPAGAISVNDNLARIDSSKCDGCGHCAEICMTKCIAML